GGYGVLDGHAGKDPITWGVPGIPGGRGLSPPAVARRLENPAGGDGRVPRHDARGGGERQVLCANPADPASVERRQLEREVGNRTEGDLGTRQRLHARAPVPGRRLRGVARGGGYRGA